MKNVVELLQRQNIICKKLTHVHPRDIGSRKRVELYTGIDLNGYYCNVMLLVKKSRVLRKEAEELNGLAKEMESLAGARVTKKYIRIEAPLCSKAKAWLEGEGWIFL